MKLRLQFGGGLLALGLSAAMALPSAAQSHNNRPPQQQRQPHAPRQTNRPPQQPGGRPQQKQEMRERARVWAKLTAEQQNHIRNDVLPAWKQLPPARRNAIKSRLNVLQNMPESARNQHLSDANFTRGMSEEDKALLRDLS